MILLMYKKCLYCMFITVNLVSNEAVLNLAGFDLIFWS